jgi:hypothetical protein
MELKNTSSTISINNNNKSDIENENSEMSNLSLDLERISMGEQLFDSIKCGLCYLISGSPLIMKCCENIICSNCINNWKQNNKTTCPICRAENFICSPPNRFEKKIFLSVKYYCSYMSEGCEEKDLTIENIILHEKICLKNPNRLIKCETCLQNYKANIDYKHNCIDFLLERNKALTEELKLIKNMMNQNPYIFSSLK